MNVLLVNVGADTGGVLIRIVRAFRDVPGWNVRAAVKSGNYIEYPADVEWRNPTVVGLWEAADVVHLHHDFITADWITGGRLGRRVADKPYVVEYHGTGFRESPSLRIREQRKRGAVGLVSTLDLYLLAPDDTEWLPTPVNVSELRTMKQPSGDRLLIAHAPTNRRIKSTEQVIEAVARLQAEGYLVDLDLIEGQPWSECLRRKAKADIYFDQVILGYGCNALEAWGMGIPVIAGAADATLDEMERRFGYLPFYHATQSTIYESIRELVESPQLRHRYSERGLRYVTDYHDEAKVVEQLKGIYQRAVEQHEEKAA